MATSDVTYPPARTAWWTLMVLMLFYLLSFLDRQVINLLVDPMKQSLGITDFQVSTLQGFSFALFYAMFGIPFGWASDRFSPRTVIFIGLIIWSLAASACGLATHYHHLLTARFLLGAGEAALAPAAYALIAGCFPPERRATALSIFTAGGGIGQASSLLLGGAIIQALPPGGMVLPLIGHREVWQIVFIVTGLPCLALAGLAFTLFEQPKNRVPGAPSATPLTALRFIGQHKRFFFGHFIGFGFLSMVLYGMSMWLPAYLSRNFLWTPFLIGATIAVISGVFSAMGGIVMGMVSDRWFRSGRTDAHMRIFLFIGPWQLVCVLIGMASGNAWVAVIGAGLAISTGSFSGLSAAALQHMCPPEIRGQVIAIFVATYLMIGLGLGPSVVAFFTDYVFRDTMMLNWSMGATYLVFMPMCIALLWMTLKPLREQLAKT